MQTFLKAIIMGAPASGKGTISSRIINHFNIQHISSGDILRRNMLNNTDLGKQVKSYIDKGQLVPDKEMIKLIVDELRPYQNKNWLLDGFPRTKEQAEILYAQQPIDVALNLVVPFEVIIERVSGRWVHLPSGRVYNVGFEPPKVPGKDDVTGEDLIQRPDDKPEAVKKRLEIYSATVGPVLKFYREKNLLKEFHGRTSNEIWPQVKEYLEKFDKIKAQ